MKSPFKFLDAFDLRDREAFFGRDEEIDQLYRMIHKNRLMLVYGQSGTGKTSLVQCGLAGRYDATDWLPLFIRRGTDLNQSLAEALAKVLNKPVESVRPATIDAVYGVYLRPLFLIFDQLEELFILGKPEEQQQFIQTIAALHGAELPCRILFIIREEYLAALYEFEQTIPSLFDRRLRVEPMSAAKVHSVLSQSFERFGITLEDPEQNLRQIIDNISAGRAGIQLPYLQVYLDLLWQEEFARRYPENGPAPDTGFPPLHFSTQEIEAFGEIGDVLGRFLERQRIELQQRLKADFPTVSGNEINRLLDVFVTEEGTKRPVTVERHDQSVVLSNIPAGAVDDIPAPVQAAALQLLEQSRLLRSEGQQTELAHDALAALIDGERSAEQRQINELNKRLRNALHEYRLNGGQELPTRKLLLDTQELLEKLRLSPELLDFYTSASAQWKRRDTAELAEKERRLGEAEQTARDEALLRQKAEKSQRRARRMAYGVGALALVAALAFFWADRQSGIARAEAKRATAAQIEADQNAKTALSNAEEARRQEAKATAQESIAVANESKANDALRGKEKANDQLADDFLKAATQQILQLDYEAARQQLHTAIALGQKQREVAGALLEIAYFFNETGNQTAAQKEINSVASLLGKNVTASESAGRVGRRAILQRLLPARFNELEGRYYPVMDLVKGGTFVMESQSGPDHQITLSDYKIARTATSVWQYNLYLHAQGK
ncbi:MAG: hypothetical protein ABIQ93_07450, partial [Saprospiraceae bacterium]